MNYLNQLFVPIMLGMSITSFAQTIEKIDLIGDWTHTRNKSIVEKITISEKAWIQEYYGRKNGNIEITTYSYEYEVHENRILVIASRKENGEPQEHSAYIVKAFDGNILELYECHDKKCKEGRSFTIVRE